MALKDFYSYNLFEDTAPEDYGIPQYVLDRLDVGAPSATTIDFGTPAGGLSQADVGVSAPSVDTTRTGALSQIASTGGMGDTSIVTAPASSTGNVLSGNILAGASWNSTNQTLADQLTAATGQQTLNTAVGGATTADTLQQLNDFTAAGGSFAPGSTVFLQTGGVDMLQGIDDNTIRSNIDQIVSTLENQGVNVVLTASPRAASLTDVVNNNFETGPASFYSDIAANHSNVAIVDTMGQILQDKSLLRDALHTNAAGEKVYNDSVIAAYQSLTPLQKTAVSNKVAASGTSDPKDLAKAIDEVAGTNVATTAAQAANTVSAEFAGQSFNLNVADVNKVKDQILGQKTTSQWTGEGFGSAEANAEAMAKNLVASGITDISQVGQKTITIPGYTIQTEAGEETVPDTTQTVLINKLTGEKLISDYGERTQGNAWSGTYAGKGNTAFRTTFDAQGRPIFYTTGASSSDIGQIAPLLAIAQFVPGLQPFALAAQAAIAIDQGDTLGGLASLAGLGGFTDAATALRVTKALDQGDMGALAMSLLQNDTVGKMAGSTMLTDTISLADAGNAYNVVDNLNKGNYAGALTSAGTLTGSSDVKTAGAALNLVNAINSGNEVAIINAAAGLNNTIKAADNLTNAAIAKSVATSVSSGADAFVQAKQAGATDEDALGAANTVTGTTKTTQVTDNRAQNTLNLDNADVNSLDEAAALAIAKGNDSFTVGGKTYIVNKATGDLPADEKKAVDAKLVNEYVKSLGKTDVSQLTDAERSNYLNNYDKFTAGGIDVLKAATLADVLSGNSTYSAAQSIENSKYTDAFPVEIRGVGNRGDATDTKTGAPTVAQNLDTAGNDLVNWANTLEGTSGDVVRQTLSTLIGAGGEQVADLGTALANMGVAERYNLLVQLGQSLERTGQNLEIPAVTQATKDFVNNIQNADTYAGKIAAALKTVIDQPLVLTQVAKEGLQEILPIVTGGTVFKLIGKTAGIAADVLMNASESMGSSSRQKFNEEIAKGTPADEAERLANADGWKAFAITAATAGVMDAALVKKYEHAMDKAVGRTATSYGKEAGEEGWEEFAIALATGDDLATAMSKSVMGSVIGAKTSGTLTAGSNVSQNIQQAFAEQGLTSTDGSFRPETIRSISDTGTAGTSGTTGGKTTVTEVDTGASTNAATDFASIFESTGNTTQAVDASVGTAISNGADVNNVVSSVVSAANTTGANVNTVAATAANAAVAAGADATTASNAATTAVSNAATGTATTTGTGTNTGTATTTSTGTNTGTATTTGTGTNTGTATTTGTGTNTGTNTNTNTNTGTDSNTNTSTNTNTGVTTNTTVDTNTNTSTTTTTNANTNTNTTVTTNTNTGVTTTTNTNNNTGIDTNTVVDTNTNTTTNTVTDTNTNTTVTITTNTDTGEVTSVDGPVTVISKDVVKIGDTVVNVNTGEVLDPSVVTKTTPVTKTPTTPSTPTRQVLMGGPSYTEPTYAAKDHDISETWLGGRFRNIAPLAGMGILMPESTPMFQETQALSALRRAAGLDSEAKTPEADYYAYGTEPSYSKVLEPFMHGGTVQNHADGGKIMASPLMAASGGDVPHKGSHYVQGAGGGQDDLIPAKLADGEYVFDAEIVAALGDGSNKEGAKKLDAMREAIRKHKRGGSLKSIPPKAKSPLAYLKGAL